MFGGDGWAQTVRTHYSVLKPKNKNIFGLVKTFQALLLYNYEKQLIKNI